MRIREALFFLFFQVKAKVSHAQETPRAGAFTEPVNMKPVSELQKLGMLQCLLASFRPCLLLPAPSLPAVLQLQPRAANAGACIAKQQQQAHEDEGLGTLEKFTGLGKSKISVSTALKDRGGGGQELRGSALRLLRNFSAGSYGCRLAGKSAF